jgi:hypothetical protein
MSFLQDFRDEVQGLIPAVWTDIQVGDAMRDRQAAYMNWRELVSVAEGGGSNGLGVPFAILEFGRFERYSGAGDANDAYQCLVRMSYVIKRALLTSGEIDDVLSAKGDAMRGAIVSSSTLQALEAAEIDWSITSPQNSYFVSKGFDFQSVEVSVRFLLGCSSEA